MTDNASAARVRPQPPRTIKIAVAAIGLQVVLTLLTSLLLWGYTSQLNTLLIKANRDLKSTDKNKRPVDTYVSGSVQLVKDLHDYRISVMWHALIVGGLFAFSAWAIWRGTGIARWLYIAAAVVFSFNGIVALESDGPRLPNALSFIIALTSIVAVILLMLSPSVRFFAAAKAMRVPASARAAAGTAGAAGAPRPGGLRGLFGPVPPRQARPTPTRTSGSSKPADTRPATRPAGSAATTNADAESTGRGKPKARTGAPGAEAATVPASSEPAGVAAGRARGKSRRV